MVFPIYDRLATIGHCALGITRQSDDARRARGTNDPGWELTVIWHDGRL
jgi:hypothetical protein